MSCITFFSIVQKVVSDFKLFVIMKLMYILRWLLLCASDVAATSKIFPSVTLSEVSTGLKVYNESYQLLLCNET